MLLQISATLIGLLIVLAMVAMFKELQQDPHDRANCKAHPDLYGPWGEYFRCLECGKGYFPGKGNTRTSDIIQYCKLCATPASKMVVWVGRYADLYGNRRTFQWAPEDHLPEHLKPKKKTGPKYTEEELQTISSLQDEIARLKAELEIAKIENQ